MAERPEERACAEKGERANKSEGEPELTPEARGERARRAPKPRASAEPELLDGGTIATLQLEAVLGEGTGGKVYRAELPTGKVVAVKVVEDVDPDTSKALHEEIRNLRKCQCVHIVQYLGSTVDDSVLMVVMEYCKYGSIGDLLQTSVLSEPLIAYVCRNVVSALCKLHEAHLIHRDIKAHNILLREDGATLLADFGVSTQLVSSQAQAHTMVGSAHWMAPEVLRSEGYSRAADIWSLGVTAVEMAEGRPPYSTIHPVMAMFHIVRRPPQGLAEPDAFSPEFVKFVQKCMAQSVQTRARARGLMVDVFVKGAAPPARAEEAAAGLVALAEEHAERKAQEPESTRELSREFSTEIARDLSVERMREMSRDNGREMSVEEIDEIEKWKSMVSMPDSITSGDGSGDKVPYFMRVLGT